MPDLSPSIPPGRPKFTILVSIWQLEPWMRQAIVSVARQTDPDFECILHVEESTDGSLAIANGFAARDGRFRVVSAPRSGSGGTARNYAIDHANGEYLVFPDGDDWLADDVLARLAAWLDQTGAVDILSFSARPSPPIPGGTIGNFRPADAADGVFSGLDAIRRAARNGGQNAGQFRAYVWLSAYRTDFLRGTGLRQPEGLLMEDLGWPPCIWFFARRFACLDATLYIYHRRVDSVMSEASSRLLFDLVAQIRSLVDFAESHAVPGDIRSIWENKPVARPSLLVPLPLRQLPQILQRGPAARHLRPRRDRRKKEIPPLGPPRLPSQAHGHPLPAFGHTGMADAGQTLLPPFVLSPCRTFRMTRPVRQPFSILWPRRERRPRVRVLRPDPPGDFLLARPPMPESPFFSTSRNTRQIF